MDLVEAALAALEEWQPVTNAASQLWPDEALAEARSRAERGTRPLEGVPVLVKENFDVEGHPTTGCCDAFRGNVAGRDATLIERLRDRGGAIVVGKANMHELAASGTNHISACGPTRNPWDPERLTGGSSGGSAAAVASRCVSLSLGTDTAGSVRIPAAFCGVTALKSTHGRLPMAGVMPLAPSFDCPGVVAGTAEDVALAFSVLAGDPVDLAALHGPTTTMRLGWVRSGYFCEWAHPDVDRAVGDAAHVLASSGVQLREVSLSGLDDALHTWSDLAWPEFAAAYPDLDLSRVGKQIAEHYSYGARLPETFQRHAHQRAEYLAGLFDAALREVDALILPTTPYTAPRFDADEVPVCQGRTVNVFHGGPVWFTCPMNIVGLPALAVPAGFDAAVLPLSVQFVGRRGDEQLLLKLGVAYQSLTDHHLRAPALPR